MNVPRCRTNCRYSVIKIKMKQVNESYKYIMLAINYENKPSFNTIRELKDKTSSIAYFFILMNIAYGEY